MLGFPNAKINLGLFVTEKRADGYHTIETVMYPVKIKDSVEINDAAKTNITIIGSEIPGSSADNLCIKAYNLLANDFDLPPQHITLLKNIPIGAGLGGGSADAAAIINLTNLKFNLDLTVAQKSRYAAQLGADCPFFIENKPVFATGIGDIFEGIGLDLSIYQLVVVMPQVFVSTKNAYSLIKPLKTGVDLKAALSKPVDDWRHFVKNDFETAVFPEHPEIGALKHQMYEQGAIFSLMSGSGAAVYGLFKQKVELELPNNYRVFYDLS